LANILAVGNATLDIINLVDSFPAEDSEVRALSQQIRRGGNSANTLVALSQLGHQCSWAGTLANEPDGSLILADLQQHHVDTSAVHTVAHGKVPTSYVTLNQQNGSRTIVHHRDLPEYRADDFMAIDLALFDWVHFEGRNIDELKVMMQHARSLHPRLPLSLEVEKVRPGIDALFPFASTLLFSKAYARHQGHQDAPSLLQALCTQGVIGQLICAWGEEGAYGIDAKGVLLHSPAFPPAQVVDTLGAGDVFNAGIIDALVKDMSLQQSLNNASHLAGKKCGIYGLNGLHE